MLAAEGRQHAFAVLPRWHVRDDADAGRTRLDLRMRVRFTHRLNSAGESAGVSADGKSRGSGNGPDRGNRRGAQRKPGSSAYRRAFYCARFSAARTVVRVLVSADGKTGMLARRVEREDLEIAFRHSQRQQLVDGRASRFEVVELPGKNGCHGSDQPRRQGEPKTPRSRDWDC